MRVGCPFVALGSGVWFSHTVVAGMGGSGELTFMRGGDISREGRLARAVPFCWQHTDRRSFPLVLNVIPNRALTAGSAGVPARSPYAKDTYSEGTAGGDACGPSTNASLANRVDY